jgi:TusA-related sulfurtransferase
MERATSNEPEVIELDARGFEPPQPLMKTLEAIATLPPGATLRLHTRWKPAMLFPELEKRGFVGESQEQSDGSCITHIRRC